jgi:hypothetical protein
MRKPCREGGSSSRCAEPRGGGLAGHRARPLSECREHAASLHPESGLAPLCHHTSLVKTAQSHDLSAECCLDKSKTNEFIKLVRRTKTKAELIERSGVPRGLPQELASDTFGLLPVLGRERIFIFGEHLRLRITSDGVPDELNHANIIVILEPKRIVSDGSSILINQEDVMKDGESREFSRRRTQAFENEV